MNNIVLTFALLSMLGLVASNATADTYDPGQASFQWAGTVPAQTDSGTNYFIVPTESTIDFYGGQLVFTNSSAAGIELVNSSTMSFKVVKHDPNGIPTYDPAVDTETLAYTATLTDLEVGIDGFISPSGADAFAVSVDGVIKAVNDQFNKPADANTTNLKIVKGTDANTLQTGDSVVVQAVLAIAPTDT